MTLHCFPVVVLDCFSVGCGHCEDSLWALQCWAIPKQLWKVFPTARRSCITAYNQITVPEEESYTWIITEKTDLIQWATRRLLAPPTHAPLGGLKRNEVRSTNTLLHGKQTKFLYGGLTKSWSPTDLSWKFLRKTSCSQILKLASLAASYKIMW